MPFLLAPLTLVPAEVEPRLAEHKSVALTTLSYIKQTNKYREKNEIIINQRLRYLLSAYLHFCATKWYVHLSALFHLRATNLV